MYLLNYLCFYKKYHQSYYLYTFDIFNTCKIEHKYITLAWGFESLIDKIYDNFPLPKSKDIELIERCLTHLQNDGLINKSKKESWKRKLEYIPGLSLEEKMFRSISKIFNDVNKKNLRDFCKTFSGYRNDLSHRGGIDKAGNKPNYQKLSIYTECIKFFYLSILMECIGVPTDDIKNIIKPINYVMRGRALGIEFLKNQNIINSL